MAEQSFEVGKRAYWIHEVQSLHLLSGKPPTTSHYVCSGVVMSTGPAVTQVWNDNGRETREHHALTFANDKIWPEREAAEWIAHQRDREDVARRERLGTSTRER